MTAPLPRLTHNELLRIQKQISRGLPIIALGTTSVRTLESIYWHGVLKLRGLDDCGDVQVGQWTPYEILDQLGGASKLPSASHSLAALLDKGTSSSTSIVINTKLLIVPGYPFQLVDGLITNFHQPRSTLLMLVAAFTGDSHDIVDVYKYAKRYLPT